MYCISHGPSQWVIAIFDPNAPRPLNRFSWNLKCITISHMQNFKGLCRRVVWAIACLMHDSFCLFHFLHRGIFAHRSHLWAHPHAKYVILRRSRQESAFLGLERLNLKFNPLYLQKHENCVFKLENCRRPNSGMVSWKNFKSGTGVDHTSGIIWHDSKVKVARA